MRTVFEHKTQDEPSLHQQETNDGAANLPQAPTEAEVEKIKPPSQPPGQVFIFVNVNGLQAFISKGGLDQLLDTHPDHDNLTICLQEIKMMGDEPDPEKELLRREATNQGDSSKNDQRLPISVLQHGKGRWFTRHCHLHQ